ncbi:hypothetical protein CSB37_00925 [bacterium DOLZORAL124_38_8]|nr:MAG: hypothetical protein CSB37_00925 [bacterium DOLZORAL124_38_8]
MKKFYGAVLSILCLCFMPTVQAVNEGGDLPACPTRIKPCKTLGIFKRSSEFRRYQATALKMCGRSHRALSALESINTDLSEAEKSSINKELKQKFIFGVTIFNNTVDGCKKKKFEQSAQVFETIYDDIEHFVIAKINRSNSTATTKTLKDKFIAGIGDDEPLKQRFQGKLSSSQFSSIPSSKNIFSSGDGEILGHKSRLKDYTGKGETGNDQLRSTLNNLFAGVKKLLIPISIFLIVFAGVQLFMISRDSVSEEIPKKRNQIFNIIIGWTVFSLAFTVVDFVIFGNGKEDFIFRDSFEGSEYQINTERSLEFARRIFGELEGIVDFLLTLFVIVSILFLIISCIRLIFGDDESYEATKKQVMQSIIASVVAISLKPLLALFYQNGQIVKPNATSVIEFALKWADYVLGFIGLMATLSLIYGGIRLIIDYGNGEAMEEAKKIIQYSVIGIVLAFSAWTIVNFFATPGDQISAFVLGFA